MEIKLKAVSRESTGKGAARKTRGEGLVPAVIYGHGIEPETLQVRKEDLQEVISGGAGTNVLIDLEIARGKKKDNHLVMIKELQKHPYREKLLHVDFLKVARDEKVTMKVPIALVGEEDSVGLRAGGTVQHTLWEVEVECLPGEVPDHLFVDIKDVQIGDHMSVSDLRTLPGITILADAEDVILSIIAPRLVAEEAEVPEEAAALEEVAPAEEKPGEAAPAEGGKEE
ncbi:MAG: 50S ribosomal protein L25 [Actinobacteria bacterium]|nr:50S ribosomal protein L25 [Actinomycetota bacterium]MBU1943616.1 50S ribosomal protein L25 [Actinomycetota bacterium]MBU2688949.1 50S ribosomal protein L25 [Actinomycetota bacterium]